MQLARGDALQYSLLGIEAKEAIRFVRSRASRPACICDGLFC